jgi:hypothetical protein
MFSLASFSNVYANANRHSHLQNAKETRDKYIYILLRNIAIYSITLSGLVNILL